MSQYYYLDVHVGIPWYLCETRLTAQFASSGGNFNNLRRSADIAVLLTNSGDSCGIAYFDVIANGLTIGVVQVNVHD